MPASPTTTTTRTSRRAAAKWASSASSSRWRPIRGADAGAVGPTSAPPPISTAVWSASVSAAGDTPRSSTRRSRTRGVRRQRRCRPPAGHLRVHQGPQGGLVVRVVGQRRFGGDLGGDEVARLQRRLRREPTRPCHRRRRARAIDLDPLALVIGQQRTARQCQRGAGSRPSGGEPALAQRVRGLTDQDAQLVHIEPIDPQRESGLGPRQTVSTEDPAQTRHEHRDLIARPGGSILAPQDLDQRRHRHRGAASEGQHLDERARLATAEVGIGQPLDDEATEEMNPQRIRRITHRPIVARASGRGPGSSTPGYPVPRGGEPPSEGEPTRRRALLRHPPREVGHDVGARRSRDAQGAALRQPHHGQVGHRVAGLEVEARRGRVILVARVSRDRQNAPLDDVAECGVGPSLTQVTVSPWLMVIVPGPNVKSVIVTEPLAAARALG